MIERRRSADGRLELWCDTRLDRPADILALYEKYGERTAGELTGEFAFVIEDRHTGAVHAARDAFGVKPLYYRLSGGPPAFSSSLRELLGDPDTARALDPEGVADYLLWDEENCERTFYRAVRRLPPGHWMSIDGQGRTRFGAWWSPDQVHPASPASDSAYTARFRELFFEAVRRRLPENGPAGAFLSGGLDSSSIAAAARILLARQGHDLHTLSTVYEDVPTADERSFIRSISSEIGVIGHEIAGDRVRLFPGPRLAQPNTHELSMLSSGLYPAAREAGVSVLLDGDGGDEVVHRGYYRLTELLRSGRLVEYARSLVALRRLSGRSYEDLVKTRTLRPLVPSALLRAWRQLRWGRRSLWFDRALFSPAFVRAAGLKEREETFFRRETAPPRSVRAAHIGELAPGPAAYAFETKAELAADFGLEHRYPFYDRDLAEFCLSLPSDQKMKRGWTKYILRRAMQGSLPDAVCWRGGKTYLSDDVVYRLARDEREALERVIIRDPSRLEPYYSIDALRGFYREFSLKPRFRYAIILWQAVLFSSWLGSTQSEALYAQEKAR